MSDHVDPNLPRMIEILENATDGREFDPAEVQSRLDDLMAAAGFFTPRPNMSEEEIDAGMAWSEAEEKEQTESPWEKAKHYGKILESPDPMGEGLIHSIYRTELNARAREGTARGLKNPYGKAWPGSDQAPSLTDRLSHDLALLRQVAEDLKTYNKRLIRRGAPYNGTQRALLIGLADLYLEFTNKNIGPFELPYAARSRFIRFCHFALAPHLSRTEASTGALSKAWQRLKEA